LQGVDAGFLGAFQLAAEHAVDEGIAQRAGFCHRDPQQGGKQWQARAKIHASTGTEHGAGFQARGSGGGSKY